MLRTLVSLDTLLILLRKAKGKLERYEALRRDGENATADRMMGEMFALRHDLITAYRGASSSMDPDDHPTEEITRETNFALRALAPGHRHSISSHVWLAARLPIRHRDLGKVTSEMLVMTVRSLTSRRRQKLHDTAVSPKRATE